MPYGKAEKVELNILTGESSICGDETGFCRYLRKIPNFHDLANDLSSVVTVFITVFTARYDESYNLSNLGPSFLAFGKIPMTSNIDLISSYLTTLSRLSL